MSWFASFFRKAPQAAPAPVKKQVIEEATKIIQNEKMVLTSTICQNVAKRIPLIKFRSQRRDETLSASHASSAGQRSTASSASPSAVSIYLSFENRIFNAVLIH